MLLRGCLRRELEGRRVRSHREPHERLAAPDCQAQLQMEDGLVYKQMEYLYDLLYYMDFRILCVFFSAELATDFTS